MRPACTGSTSWRGATSKTSRPVAPRSTRPRSRRGGRPPGSTWCCARRTPRTVPTSSIATATASSASTVATWCSSTRPSRSSPAATVGGTACWRCGTASRSSPRCGPRGPRATFVHHVHADMWRQVLSPGPGPARRGARAAGSRPRSTGAPRSSRPSESSRAQIVGRLRLPADRVTAIPNGIHDRFSPAGARSPHPLVLCVGRLVPHKRVDLVIRAAAEARGHRPRSAARDRRRGLRATRARAAGARARRRGLGAADGRASDEELVDLYRQAWTVISASTDEGWGMTITEAAACGTPAVATRIAGHVDVIADGESGLLADTPAELTAALTSVLTDADQRARLGAGALRPHGRPHVGPDRPRGPPRHRRTRPSMRLSVRERLRSDAGRFVRASVIGGARRPRRLHGARVAWSARPHGVAAERQLLRRAGELVAGRHVAGVGRRARDRALRVARRHLHVPGPVAGGPAAAGGGGHRPLRRAAQPAVDDARGGGGAGRHHQPPLARPASRARRRSPRRRAISWRRASSRSRSAPGRRCSTRPADRGCTTRRPCGARPGRSRPSTRRRGAWSTRPAAGSRGPPSPPPSPCARGARWAWPAWPPSA